MGCTRTGIGRRKFPVGRYAFGVLLSVFICSLRALGAFPAPAGAQAGGPAPLSFGNQQVGTQSRAQSIHLQNTGTIPLVFENVQATANFAQTNTCQPSVAVGANCDIHVTFNPMTHGPLKGTLTVTTNTAGPPYEVQLSGTGVLPALTVSPDNLTFNSQDVGTTSAVQQVTVTNNAAIGLNITSLEISRGWTQNNNCQPSIGPHSSCTINVSFQPKDSGPRNGNLSFTDYAANSPQSVTLSGTGTSTGLSLSPTSLDYGGQAVSTTSAAQSITVTNNSSFAVTSLTIAPNGDFAQTNNCGGSVPANSSCTINVTFTPTGTGNRNGGLVLTDSSANSPQSASLSGTGLGGSSVWLSSSNVSFPNQPVGTRSASPQVTVQNTGSQNLNITSISLAGGNTGDFSLSQNCGTSLAPNATCQITLAFIPSANGARNATVSIVDTAGDSPQTIALSGTGVGP